MNTYTTFPLDPNLAAGIGRILGGITRSSNVVLDTPHGGVTNPEVASWLYVGTAGNVSLVQPNGTTQIYTNMLAGTMYRISSLQVNSSGTTASGLVWGS